MNKSRFVGLLMVVFILPLVGNTPTKSKADQGFFTKKISELTLDLKMQLNRIATSMPSTKEENDSNISKQNNLTFFNPSKPVSVLDNIRHLNNTAIQLNYEIQNPVVSFGIVRATTISRNVMPSNLTSTIDCASGSPYTIPAPTHRTIANGNWTSSSTWQGGNIPSGSLNGLIVQIDHQVTWNSGNDLTIGNGMLNVFNILTIPNDNVIMNHINSTLHLVGGVIISPNGNFELNTGSVNMHNGAIQLCNGNYISTNSSSTNGSGYLFVDNGNIEINNSGNFSIGIAWCVLSGNGTNLPTAENCGLARPTNGCNDTNFYLEQCPIINTTSGEKIVKGTVYPDTNEDGVDNEGVGISGVMINIYEDVNQDGQVDNSDNLIGTELTDAAGDYTHTIAANAVIATDDFTDATWDGTTWTGGTGWAGGWNDDYGESGGNLGPNLGTDGGNGWNVAILDCNQTNNHNNCEPFGTPKLSLENDDYISRPINLSGYSSVDFSFDLETVSNNDNDDVLTIKICTDNTETNCYTLYTNGFNNGNFAETPITVTATLNDPTYLIANAELFFHIEGFSGSAEYIYIGGVSVLNNNSITSLVMEVDTNTIPVNHYFTTDNIETAIFTTSEGTDINNDFGIGQSVRVENEVWLDLNANALNDPLEIGIANMEICLSNQSPILVNGVTIPIGGYVDTIYSDANGIYVFDNVPDCNNWEIVVHNPPALYSSTFDADAGILPIVNFNLNNGRILPTDNAWCQNSDCINDLDFGFRLMGDYSLVGTICIDDGSKDGTCGTGGEEGLTELTLLLYDEVGTFFGGVSSAQTGAYEFPFLPEDTYLVSLGTNQMSLDTFFLTTQLGDTPASTITQANSAIFQKVPVLSNVLGVDYAFIPHHLAEQKTVEARDDLFNSCPGTVVENTVATNDIFSGNNIFFAPIINPNSGTIKIENNGIFIYTPTESGCSLDQFTYQMCDLNNSDCDTATVTLLFEDNTPPTILGVPDRITLSCDERIPDPELVSTFDNCPGLGIEIEEVSTQGEDGCSQHDYSLTRTWIATDLCGNTNASSRVLKIEDVVAPDIFRVYTLPNGKKMVAGISEYTGEKWKIVSFPLKFSSKPLVFTQIITNNEATPAIVQTRRISTNQMEIRIQEEENNDNQHIRESIAWMAIESGEQIEGYHLVADELKIDEQESSITFGVTFANTPAFFTSIQTTVEQDAVIVKHENLTNSGVSLQLIEETSKDIELIHNKEKIAYLGIENIGNLTNKRGDIIGEVGKMTIDGEWTTIPLNHTYHNPVIIANIANNIENFPVTLRVDNVSPSSFAIQIQEWEYLNFTPNPTVVSYMVIEGSIPLYVPNYCDYGTDSLINGIDIKVIDNCDNSVELNYRETKNFNGAVQVINRTWQSTDECGNSVAYTQEIHCEGVAVQVKTLLQGALIGSDGVLMRDDLRKKGFLPFEEPYSKLAGFKHVGSGGGERMDSTLLEVSGPNAIVDWVLLEVRSAENIDSVVATSSGLVQRDGDVIAPTGDTLITFENTQFSDYYVSIKHRNHIGMTTKEPHSFALNNVPKLDFKNVFTPTDGNRPAIKLGDKNAQWSGDLNGDGRTIYQGPHNDPFEMFLEVILDVSNENYLVNYIYRGYTQRDFNLDGQVIFQGPNNDRSNLLFNTVLAHPDNDRFLANFVVVVAENEVVQEEGSDNSSSSGSGTGTTNNCLDTDGDGFITVCYSLNNGPLQTKTIEANDWDDYAERGATCGPCSGR